jgi:hypothetical protein
MRVLVACEFSGVVRRAFRALGHDAWSCDLLPAEDGETVWHFQDDARNRLTWAHWDLMIAHPPCTFMANSGAKHLYIGMKKENGKNPERWRSMEDAAAFFLDLWNAPIDRIAVENPIMLGHAQQLIGTGPTQIIQPWQRKPQPLRTVVSTKAEDIKARRKRADVVAQLALVYTAVVPLEQRKADTSPDEWSLSPSGLRVEARIAREVSSDPHIVVADENDELDEPSLEEAAVRLRRREYREALHELAGALGRDFYGLDDLPLADTAA